MGSQCNDFSGAHDYAYGAIYDAFFDALVVVGTTNSPDNKATLESPD
ncbi:MAG: hypothetical protein R3C28_14400 [Pirellulaceae bacterium]